jgi:hypothetical protein
MSIPPVFIQLGRSLPGLLLKPALLYATLTFLQHSHEFELPTWVVVISLLLVNTISSKIYAFYIENQRERDAAASNAVPVKMVDMTAWQAVGAMRKSFLHSLTPSTPLSSAWLRQFLKRDRYFQSIYSMTGQRSTEIPSEHPCYLHLKTELVLLFIYSGRRSDYHDIGVYN